MSEQEIDALRQRWQSDMSPALTLELAGEYRRRDQPERALEVLEAGLEAAPNDLDARVAKGGCHLDLGQLEPALGELHRVVGVDPAHSEANRLLVDVHARLGEPERARDRLDFFAFLGGDRQEVAELERRLEEPGPEPDGEAAEALGETGGEPWVDATSVRETPAVETPVAESAVEATEAGEAPPSDGDEPFELPRAAPQGGLRMDEAGPILPGRFASDAATVRIEVVSDEDPFSLEVDEASYRAALLEEGLFALPDATPASRGAPAPAAEPGEATAPTMTLANLYRKQGHHQEAAAILRQILDRQPGNPEAARALAELQKEHGWDLSAEDLLGGAGDPNPSRGGRTADQLLKRYRERLRGEG